MCKIVVVYFSSYGHTTKQAQAVANGANAELIAIDQNGNITDAEWETLNQADAIIFGSPTYMGNYSWQFKRFADSTSKIWYTQGWKNKIFAGFTNSASMNGDKGNTLQALFTLAMQHGGLWVGPGLMPSNTKAAQRNDLNYLGSYTGAMMQSPSDSSPDEVVEGDLETARLLGIRVAEVAAHYNN